MSSETLSVNSIHASNRGANDEAARPGSFLILGDARTGTTMLRDLLRQHPDIACAGEWISNDVETIFQGVALARFIPFKSRIIASPLFKAVRVKRYLQQPREEQAVGFKALYEQVPDVTWQLLTEQVDRFVLILRKDSVRRALSLIKARATGQWNLLSSKDAKLAPKRGPIGVDPDELRREIQASEARDDLWSARIADLGPRGITLTYEDLVVACTPVVARVLDFLGADASLAGSLNPGTVRMSEPKPLSAMISNYAAVLEDARGSALEGALKDFEKPLA